MLKKLRQISSKLILKNPYWEYKLDEYEKPNGEPGEYHYINSRGSTFVIPRLNKNKFILIKQYRYLNSRESLEFPGGGIAEGFEPYENAKRELKEETGITAGEIIKIGEVNPFNGVTNELCSVYLADDLKLSEAQPDDSEQFEIVELSEQEIIELIQKGEIWDGMTVTAWALYYFSLYRL